MIPHSLLPPLRHRAVVERNVEGGLSPTRQLLPPRFEQLHSALPCHFWEVETLPGQSATSLRLGPNTDVVVEGLRMLVRRDADVDVGDEVPAVTVAVGGTVITDQRMRVVRRLWRSTHRELGLELIRGRPLPAEGS